MKKHLKDIFILIIVFFCMCTFICSAQVPQEEIYTFKSLDDGTYKMVSWRDSTSPPVLKDNDVIVRTNGKGEVIWYNAIKLVSEEEEIINTQSTLDEGWIIAGYTIHKDAVIKGEPSDYDYWVVRLTSGNDGTYLFPNPFYTETSLFVLNEYINKEYFVRVFDSQGKVVISFPVIDKQTKIKKGDLSSGIYTYSIDTSELSGPKGKFIIL